MFMNLHYKMKRFKKKKSKYKNNIKKKRMRWR